MLNRLSLKNEIAWWLQGLSYLLPSFLIKLVNKSDIVTIIFNQHQIDLYYFSESLHEAQEKKSFNINDEIEKTKALSWLKEKTKNNVPITLAIPEDLILINKMAYPITAEANLRQIFEHEISRKTPFTSEQTLYDYSVIRRDGEKIFIKTYIVARKHIDNYLNVFKAWDIKLDKIHPIGINGINLIAPGEKQNKNNQTNLSLLSLATLTLLLLIAVFLTPIMKQEEEIALLKLKILDNKNFVTQLKELKQYKQNILEKNYFLENKRVNETNSLDMLDLVSKILPDDTWLTRFVMKAGELQLQGESSNASSLIELLESSEYLTAVKFRSPITVNKANNKDKFHLSANYQQN